jgi:hypothetical protein
MIKEGSKWTTTDGKVFHVLHCIELDGHLWVHYISETNAKEYSCYEESFLERFHPLAE